MFWEANCLGCCKWRAMWWTWWEVLADRNFPKSIMWINWSPSPPCLLAAVEGVHDAPPVPGPHHLHHGLPPLLVRHVVGRVHAHHQPLSSVSVLRYSITVDNNKHSCPLYDCLCAGQCKYTPPLNIDNTTLDTMYRMLSHICVPGPDWTHAPGAGWYRRHSPYEQTTFLFRWG